MALIMFPVSNRDVNVIYASETLRQLYRRPPSMAISRWRQRLVRVECDHGSGCHLQILLGRFGAIRFVALCDSEVKWVDLEQRMCQCATKWIYCICHWCILLCFCSLSSQLKGSVQILDIWRCLILARNESIRTYLPRSIIYVKISLLWA